MLGSLAGSVISNLLLVYGVTQVVGPDGARIDRRSLLVQLALVGVAVVAFVVPTAIGHTGAPQGMPRWPPRCRSRSCSCCSTSPSSGATCVATGSETATARSRARTPGRCRLRSPSLAVATGATAWVSEILVHSLDAFAKAVGLSEFFISVVIVAIVGNAAEHGGAIVIARNGKMRLASEIAISSSAQVALLVVPVVMLLSLLFTHHLALTFRWSELFAMAAAAAVVTAVVWDGRSNRREGAMLCLAYAAAVVAFYLGGGR